MKSKVKDVENDNNHFIVFGKPTIGSEEINEVIDSLKSGWLGTGPKVAKFIEDFKEYKHTKYATALNSCTAALYLSLMSLNLKREDEVITTPLTFCATVNSIIHCGAKPVLADINPLTMNIDPEEVEAKITKNTKAIVPVHFAGRPCEMDELMSIAQKYNLKIIEDCAHAIEGEYKGKKLGTIGDFGCFSFYVTKNVVTGEGGMVITKNEEDLNRIKILSLHGLSSDAWKRFSDDGYKHYLVHDAGYKFNMMDIQAAIGIHQLARVEKNWVRRKEIWEIYNNAFKSCRSLEIPAPIESYNRHSYHLYPLLIDQDKTNISRDQFINKMTELGIGVGVHYLSIPEHPFYQKTFGWNVDDFPHSKKIGRQSVSIPISAGLSDEEIKRIINSVYKAIDK